ncbi:MAG: hypothetical protein AAB275_05950 [Deltaproteobacteria bacterium]
MKSQTDSTTRAPKGQTALGEMGELGKRLPMNKDAKGDRFILSPLSALLCRH